MKRYLILAVSVAFAVAIVVLLVITGLLFFVNLEKCSAKSGNFIRLTVTNVLEKTWTTTCSSAAVPRTTIHMDDVFLSSLSPKVFVSATTRMTFYVD